MHICKAYIPTNAKRLTYPISFSDSYYFGSGLKSLSKVASAFASAHGDPYLSLQEEKKFISDFLNLKVRNLFMSKEIGLLILKLPYMFRQREFEVREDGQKIVRYKNDQNDALISSPIFLFSTDLSSSRISEKIDFIFELQKEWKKEFALSSECIPVELKLGLIKFKSNFSKHNIKLIHNEDTTHEEVLAITSIFKLLPKSILETFRQELSGGIHLSLSEYGGLGEYNPESKEIYLGKSKFFSTRGYLELILHELGHVCEDNFTKDPLFINLYNKAKLNMYKLPALDEDGLSRKNYISKNISEFFAETFMHYVLQGRGLRNSFTSDIKLSNDIYCYFKEKVFSGCEYTESFVKVPHTYEKRLVEEDALRKLTFRQEIRSMLKYSRF